MNLRETFNERRLTDETLAARCREQGVRINRVEADVLVALNLGVADRASAMELTGYTAGQVEHAIGVLIEQGLATAGAVAP